MSLISPQQAQDGVTSVNAAAINNPINTIANDYNGNITDANIASAAAINFAKISGGSSTALSAWQSYTPTVTLSGGSAANGNAAIVASYTQIGKVVFFIIEYTLGTTTVFTGLSNISATLPVTALAKYGTATAITYGYGHARISGINYPVQALSSNTTTFQLVCLDASANYLKQAGIGASTPAAWATSDRWQIIGSYEAA